MSFDRDRLSIITENHYVYDALGSETLNILLTPRYFAGLPNNTIIIIGNDKVVNKLTLTIDATGSAKVAGSDANDNEIQFFNSKEPLDNWFIKPTLVTDGNNSPLTSELATFTNGNIAPDYVVSGDNSAPVFRVPNATTVTRRYTLPAMNDGMCVIELIQNSSITWTINKRESFDNGATWSATAPVSLVQRNTDNDLRANKIDLAASSQSRIVELTFAHNRTADESTGVDSYLVINSIGFYEFDGNNNHDYIVVIGASISQNCIRQRDWFKWWKQQFNSYPVVFNEAVSGWNSAAFASGVSAIIARHPRANVFFIEYGGNDVSEIRPFSTATQAAINIRVNSMITALNLLRVTGKKIIISNTTYRNYTGSPAVNGATNQENGSLPFIQNVFNRLSNKYSPVSFASNTALVDAYTWGVNNIHLLDLTFDASGVHYLGYGGSRLSEFWALAVGGLLKYQRPVILENESNATGVVGAKQHVRISFGASRLELSPLHFLEVGTTVNSHYNLTWQQGGTGESLTTADVLSCVNVEGERCSIGLNITNITGSSIGFSGAVSGNDTPYLDKAQRSFVFVPTGAGNNFEFNLTGLTTGKTYTIRVMASRAGITSRLTLFTVAGVAKTLDAANNTTNIQEWTGVAPTSNNITVKVEANAGASFGYINWLEIFAE